MQAGDESSEHLAPFEDVERWAAEARTGEAVGARVRERWLRRQAEEEATFAALLLAVGERGDPVVLVTTDGRHHQGPVHAVGADFVALRAPGGRTTVVAMAAVAAAHEAAASAGRSVRRRSDGSGGGGGHKDERPRTVRVTMADVLAHAVEHRPRVQLRSAGAVHVGELRSVGDDVVTLLADGEPRPLVYLRLPSLSEASFLDSG